MSVPRSVPSSLRSSHLWLPNARSGPPTLRIVFDLEFAGNPETPTACRIWQIAARAGDARFSRFVIPMLDDSALRESSPVPIDRLRLIEQGAVSEKDALISFFQWMDNTAQGTFGDHFPSVSVIAMSHNCFRVDQHVLTAAFRRHHVHPMLPVKFFDTLKFVRWHARKLARKPLTYSLVDVAGAVGVELDVTMMHDARYDSDILWSTLTKLVGDVCNVTGLLCDWRSVSPTAVKGIGVDTAEKLFNVYGIVDLRDLLIRMLSESPDRSDWPEWIALTWHTAGCAAGSTSALAPALADSVLKFDL